MDHAKRPTHDAENHAPLPPIPSHWEGDYRDLSTDDFLEDASKPSPGPLYTLIYKNALTPTIYWSVTLIIATIFHWLYGHQYDLTASYQSVFQGDQVWKLWSSLWIHSDIEHLLSNLWLFSVFAYLLRAFWGPSVFPVLSFGILGALTTATTIYHYGPGPRLLGASGMIYGMIGLWLVTYCRYETRFSLGTRIFRSIGFVLIMLFPTTVTKNVSYSAHAFGFLWGLGFGTLLILMRGNNHPEQESERALESPKAVITSTAPQDLSHFEVGQHYPPPKLPNQDT
ncbi:rhomboid family intramembrane serine protease [Pseudobacteriovorax antillogorgiicola]|uniref:Membrane associated serine protease, rhomboid family n=1 Tax=Pseudobacteriovorax antillogorgiicola TaxID=1513793 RepID=A0A1Y6BIU0_9BACT|nr:rhomboid family intramembrane serine protease [Pseudobacteriovorax antillogorgiicola]TCS55430.1 membrane associated rhomboid family serine protease [Pseudobacteriovorax antillogorgiicola]SMF12523.1 Membrane associated serine protease, rhomboid family [Pseudobacteriovorax antillogorgiicola]